MTWEAKNLEQFNLGHKSLSNIRSQKGYICLEGVEKKKKSKGKQEDRKSTPRLSQQKPFGKGEFNPREANIESHKIHQAYVWEGNQKGERSVKQMVYFVMCHFTKIGSEIVPSSIDKAKKNVWGCGDKYSHSVEVSCFVCLVVWWFFLSVRGNHCHTLGC